MNQISFFTTANYGNAANTFSESLLDKVDNYFFLWGRKAEVIPGYKQGNSEGVVYTSYKKPSVITALKIVSYVTLVLPLIALIAKIILRTIHKFHLIPNLGAHTADGIPPHNQPSPPYIGSGPELPPDPPNFKDLIPELDFDKPALLTRDEVVKLQIKPHDGTSELKEYQDSWFEYRWIDSNQVVVTRRRLADRVPILPFDAPMRFLSKEVVKYQLRYVELNEGVSDLHCYRDSYFNIFQEWSDQDNDLVYTVIRRVRDDRDYRYIPVRCAMRLSEKEFTNLNMEITGSEHGWALGRSPHPEYYGSLFAWKECDSGIVIYRY